MGPGIYKIALKPLLMPESDTFFKNKQNEKVANNAYLLRWRSFYFKLDRYSEK